MRVAVISVAPTLGKTCFMSVLGGVFSRSQARNVCILSTGDGRENVEIIDVKIRNDEVTNPYVFKSILSDSENGDKNLFNYGLRQGDENVFIYDVMSSSTSRSDKEDFFMDCIKKIPADLTLIEIVGDYKDEFNQRAIKACDCILLLFDTSIKSFEAVRKWREEASEATKRVTGYVCSMYNPEVISEKKINKELGVGIGNMLFFPYSPVVKRLAVEGNLDRAAYSIISGDVEIVRQRSRMMECMQFLFDTPERKIIRGYDRWYK